MDDWNVVQHKKGSRRRSDSRTVNFRASFSAQTEKIPSVGTERGSGDAAGVDGVAGEDEEEKLVAKCRRAIEKVERSTFFSRFIRQMQDLEVLKLLSRQRADVAERDTAEILNGKGSDDVQEEREVESTEDDSGETGIENFEAAGQHGRTNGQVPSSTVQLVLYGVGSIANTEISRCQLALALLLKKKFANIGQILVYDPIMNLRECGVMRTLGCTPLEVNEDGKRVISEPTLFYMPHNEVELYDAVLRTNLEPFNLRQLVILGNSFRSYKERWSVCPTPHGERPVCLLKVQEFAEEIPVADDFSPSAFNDTSWHLFFKVEASQVH